MRVQFIRDIYYRETDPNEAARHFIDLEIWNPNLPSSGTLPQSIVEFSEKMSLALRTQNWNDVLLLAGRVSHYMTDATEPYHTTINYNPRSPKVSKPTLLVRRCNHITFLRTEHFSSVIPVRAHRKHDQVCVGDGYSEPLIPSCNQQNVDQRESGLEP